MRSRYTEQLELLNRELIQMGSLCEEAIALSSKALTEGDTSLAKKVAPLDGEIDRRERGIESLCLKLLLQQQPPLSGGTLRWRAVPWRGTTRWTKGLSGCAAT